jgi:hypothetical protein
MIGSMMLTSFLLWILGGMPMAQTTVSEVPCKTIADCWLDAEGKPIARPKAKRGRSIPRGDCGKNLLWLRNRLSCENQVCTAQHVGDRC